MKQSKKLKRLIALLGILIIVCCATVYVIKYEEKKEQIKNSEDIILEISSETVTDLSWSNETTSVSFHKNENGWHYSEDEQFPVNEKKIGDLLELFEAFAVSFEIENVEDMSMYGLEDPVAIIQITTEDSISYELRLGDFSTMDFKRYVSIGDGKVYLVSDDPLDMYNIGLSDMIRHDEDLDYEQITQISFEGAENYTVVYEEGSTHTYNTEDRYFTEYEDTIVPLDTASVDAYLEILTALNPTNYVNYKVTDDELTDYGMDEPELIVTVDYVYTDYEDVEKTVSDSFVIRVGRNQDTVKEVEASIQAAKESGNDNFEAEAIPAYIRIGESGIIYEITESSYEALMRTSFNDLRHKEAFNGMFDNVKQLNIALEGNEYILESQVSEDDEEATVWSYDENEIDISGIQSAISNLTATDFTNEKVEDKEEISVILHLDNEYFPTVEIHLYRYDGDSCLAVVDGKSFALIDRSNVVNLIEAVHSIVLNKSTE